MNRRELLTSVLALPAIGLLPHKTEAAEVAQNKSNARRNQIILFNFFNYSPLGQIPIPLESEDCKIFQLARKCEDGSDTVFRSLTEALNEIETLRNIEHCAINEFDKLEFCIYENEREYHFFTELNNNRINGRCIQTYSVFIIAQNSI